MNYKIALFLLIINLFSSCQSNVTDKELDFVRSRAWVRSDSEGLIAMFYFDTLTGPSFYLKNDSLFLYNGEVQGVITSVDTIRETLILSSVYNLETTNYKKMNRGNNGE